MAITFASVNSITATDNVNHTLTLPAFAAGDRLVAFINFDSDGTPPTITGLEAWTPSFDAARCKGYTRVIATGDAFLGTASVAIVSSNAQQMTATVFRVTGLEPTQAAYWGKKERVTGTEGNDYIFPNLSTFPWGVTIEESLCLAAIAIDRTGVTTIPATAGLYSSGFTGSVPYFESAAASSGTAMLIESAILAAGVTAIQPSIIVGSANRAGSEVAIVLRGLVAGVSPPSIANASDEIFLNGETGIAIDGSNFGATQGTGKVWISPTDNVNGVGRVEQTVTAWGASQVTITAVRGALGFNNTRYLFVVTNGGLANATGYPVIFRPRVVIRETLVNLSAVPLASATGLLAFVWKTEPTAANATPVQILEGMTTDAAGLTAWEITQGGLANGDPIWLAVMLAGSPYKATFRKLIPAYE